EPPCQATPGSYHGALDDAGAGNGTHDRAGSSPDAGFLAELAAVPFGNGACVTSLHFLRLSVQVELHQPEGDCIALLGGGDQLDPGRRPLRDRDFVADGHVAGDVRREGLAALLLLDGNVFVERDRDGRSRGDGDAARDEAGRPRRARATVAELVVSGA